MRAEVPLTIGVLCIGIGVEGALRWGTAAGEEATTAVLSPAAEAPGRRWAARLPGITARRTGSPPTLKHDPAKDGRRGCRKKIAARHLSMFSDEALAASGLPGLSPIVVLADGKPLAAQPASEPLVGRCQGASAFINSAVVFTPETTEEAEFSLALSEALPLQTPTGPAWWVYTGSGLSLSVPEAEALTGLKLTARVWAKRMPGEPPEPVTLTVAGQEVALRDLEGSLVGSLAFSVPEGDWSVAVVSPAGGPNLVVERLTLSDGEDRVDLLAAR